MLQIFYGHGEIHKTHEFELPPRIAMVSGDCRKFNNIVLTFIINHQKFITRFINIINDVLVNTR